MTEETWRPVIGHAGYEVSDHGRVRSLDRVRVFPRRDRYSGRQLIISRSFKGKILKVSTQDSGHQSVHLGAGTQRLVHHLVLEAFVGPRPPMREALHGDGKPSNNRPENLRWGTHTQNVHDAIRHGTMPMGVTHYATKFTERDVIAIREMLKTSGVAVVARHFNTSAEAVGAIKHRRTWKHLI